MELPIIGSLPGSEFLSRKSTPNWAVLVGALGVLYFRKRIARFF